MIETASVGSKGSLKLYRSSIHVGGFGPYRSISHDHDTQNARQSLVPSRMALELVGGTYQSVSAMLDQAGSEQESAKIKYSSKQIQIIAETGGVRGADRAF